jgi:SDR family mycofactocin-dependent oxidoreductase
MGRLDGRVALITGAARGQGRSHAIGLAAEGADIVALDLCRPVDTVPYPLSTPDDLAETVKLVEEQDRRIIARQVDVRDLAALRDLVTEARTELGRLDIAIANAGIMPTIGEHGDDDQAFYDAIDINLTGVWHTVRAVVPTMIAQGEGGSIVITSSTAGLRGLTTHLEAGSVGYAAAKHGVVGIMRAYANLLGDHRIRVNTVHPTGVNSPMVINEAFGSYTEEHPEVMMLLRNLLPVPLIEPDDITRAIIWLVSNEGRYVTGATIPIDAGFTARV